MLGAVHLSADYLEDQQKEARDRAAYWEARGYKFDPTYMAAFMMDQKVKDIERSKFWAAKGYKFDPAYMADFMMDQKVKDIDRARFWAAKGYKFDPTYMADFMMDQKVKDIERAKFWAATTANPVANSVLMRRCLSVYFGLFAHFEVRHYGRVGQERRFERFSRSTLSC